MLVIDENGVNLGEMSKEDAIKAADKVDLDLVCVAPKAKVPVCRFMDFKKYLYEIGRRAKDSRKNQKIVVVKEIRLSPVIGGNDFEIKLKNCKEFLADGSKVKVTLFYPKGKRRLLQMESSNLILDKFVEALSDVATVESTVQVEGRTTAVILTMKKTK